MKKFSDHCFKKKQILRQRPISAHVPFKKETGYARKSLRPAELAQGSVERSSKNTESELSCLVLDFAL